jgi:hypothetical protein
MSVTVRMATASWHHALGQLRVSLVVIAERLARAGRGRNTLQLRMVLGAICETYIGVHTRSYRAMMLTMQPNEYAYAIKTRLYRYITKMMIGDDELIAGFEQVAGELKKTYDIELRSINSGVECAPHHASMNYQENAAAIGIEAAIHEALSAHYNVYSSAEVSRATRWVGWICQL